MKQLQAIGRFVFLMLGAMFATGAMAAPAKVTAVWTPETILHEPGKMTTGYFNVTEKDGTVVKYTFSTSGNIETAYYNANITDQSLGNVGAVIDASGMFGITKNTTITPVLEMSLAGSDKTSFNIAATTAFNLLAVHVGGGELLFGWTPKTNTPFMLTSSLAGNLSNYREYSATGPGFVIQSAIPEPQTYLMLAFGLLAVGFMVRRRNAVDGDRFTGNGFAM